MVVHSDLPRAKDLASLGARSADVVLVPDRHGDGTNVLLLPCSGDFAFHYGPGSCAAHLANASHIGLSIEVVHRDDLALDLDTPDDLHASGLTASKP